MQWKVQVIHLPHNSSVAIKSLSSLIHRIVSRFRLHASTTVDICSTAHSPFPRIFRIALERFDLQLTCKFGFD